MQTFKAKLESKGQATSGVSQRTGNEWNRQDITFTLLREDGSESTDKLMVTCMNKVYIDAPAMQVGATGKLDVYFNEREYNGRKYQDISLAGFTPQVYGQEEPTTAPNGEKVDALPFGQATTLPPI